MNKFFLLVIGIFLLSCVSEPVLSPDQTSPAWIQDEPREDAKIYEFVLQASATDKMIAGKEIQEKLSSSIWSKFSFQKTSDIIDSFKTSLAEKVEVLIKKGKNELGEIVHEYLSNKDNITIYYKFSILKAFIVNESARIERQISERDHAKLLKSLEENTKKSSILNAITSIKQNFQSKNITKVEAKQLYKIIAANLDATTVTYSATLIDGAGSYSLAINLSPEALDLIKGLRIDFVYPNGQISKTLETSPKIQIDFPKPKLKGNYEAKFNLNLENELFTLDGDFSQEISDILNDLKKVSGTKQFSIEKIPSTIPIAIIVADVLEKNNFSRDTNFAIKDLQMQMQNLGLQIQSTVLGTGFLIGKSDEDIVITVKSTIAKAVQRLLYGKYFVDSITSQNGGFIAKGHAQVKLIVSATGEKLYTGDLIETGEGSTKALAQANLFEKLSKEIANNLYEALP